MSEPLPFPNIRSLAVVGAGYMGWQISLQTAIHGVPVTMIDVSAESLARARNAQQARMAEWIAEGKLDGPTGAASLDRIRCSGEIDAAGAADLVIEAIPERLELKRELFAKLDSVCAYRTILATNSSSLRISQIEDVTARPDRVLNLHFFGPVWLRPMAEIMGGSATSDATISAASDYVRRIGLTPLLVRKESTGFLFNRVWRAIKKESLRVAGSGIASFEDVDRAWMIFMNHRMGPFGLMDEVGLDVIREIEMVYYRESGDPTDHPPRLLLDLVERGDLGVKTGRGFYSYPDPAFQHPDFLRGQ